VRAVTDVLARTSAIVAAFFAWWFGELAGLVPGWLRRPFQRTAGWLVLDLSQGDVVVRHVSGRHVRDIGQAKADPANPGAEATALSQLLRRAGRRRLSTVLRLPAGNALRKRLSFPLAAAENLREVLGFEMDRQTPFAADRVYYDFVIAGRDRDAQSLEVDLVAVPRAEVDAALSRVAAWGVTPDVVDIAEGEAQAGPSINLLPGADAPAGRSVGWVTATLLVIALMLAAVVVYLPIDRQQRAVDLLDAEARRARVSAMAAVKLREEVTRLRREGAFLANRRRATPKAVEVLDAVTRLVPDHTWLQQLRIQGREIRLTGLSDAASGLVGAIEGSALFSEARFRSPVTQDARAGKERFTLSATIANGADKGGGEKK
jgi:general secretion pathway protein L